MRDPSRRRTHLCLWHAKYSGLATRWIGEQFAEGWSAEPDDIVLGLGSGSTLEGFAFPLKNRFARRPRIVVAEHARSPLLLQHPVIAGLTSAERDAPRGGDYRSPPSNTVPHAVLGPHYDDVNPFLRPCDLAEIDGVVRYSDPTWQEVSSMCRGAGICVGNSSAANLAVSRHLAEQGRTVFTFLYEPLRDFYLSPHDVCHRPLLSQAEFVKAVD
jgi:cysteine synthase